MDIEFVLCSVLAVIGGILVISSVNGAESELFKRGPRYSFFSRNFPLDPSGCGFYDMMNDEAWFSFGGNRPSIEVKKGIWATVSFMILSSDFDIYIKVYDDSFSFWGKLYKYDSLPESSKQKLDVFNRFGFEIKDLGTGVKSITATKPLERGADACLGG